MGELWNSTNFRHDKWSSEFWMQMVLKSGGTDVYTVDVTCVFICCFSEESYLLPSILRHWVKVQMYPRISELFKLGLQWPDTSRVEVQSIQFLWWNVWNIIHVPSLATKCVAVKYVILKASAISLSLSIWKIDIIW